MKTANRLTAPVVRLARREWISRFDRTGERKFFFYATVAMLLIWLGLKLT